jgi:hypothetical protein
VSAAAVNVQFMVKDLKKYAATGGWGYADFTNGKPGNDALHNTCYSCHQPAKDRFQEISEKCCGLGTG